MDLPPGWTWDDVLALLGEHVDVDTSAREHGAIKRMRAIRTGTQLLRVGAGLCAELPVAPPTIYST
jgi:hypothetical protein